MRIQGGRLYYDDGQPVPFVASPNYGKRSNGAPIRIEPTGITLHDTSDRLNPTDSVTWFKNPASKVSAHFVVGRDGSIVQMVPVDVMAYHAGKSEWRGRSGCNGFMVGIEIDNPGKLIGSAKASKAVAWYGGKDSTFNVDADRLIYTPASCTTHGPAGWWLPYPEVQLQTVEAIVRALLDVFPTIKEIVGHYEISPGRKCDPGLQFPMARFKALATPASAVIAHSAMTSDVQKRLSQLGYWHGNNDGALGTLTRQALRTFQEQNGIPITGEPDAATLRVLASDHALPMPSPREAMTTADVAAKSSTLPSAAQIKTAATVALGLTGGLASSTPTEPSPAQLVIPQLPAVEPSVAAPQLGDAMTRIDGAVATLEQGRSLGDRAASLLDWIWTPRGFFTLLLILAFLVIWSRANKIEWRRLLAEKLGWHLQPN